MGCYNKISMMSGLPIEANDETVLVFMSVNGTSSWRKDMSGTCYSHDYFIPTFLPIFGQYDDYGKIDSIKDTSSVKFIEEFFGESIVDIIEKVDDNAVGRGKDEIKMTKNQDLFKKLTFGLEHKLVYDKLVTECRVSYDRKELIEYICQWGTRDVLPAGARFPDAFMSKYIAEKSGIEYKDPVEEFINKIGEQTILDFLSFNNGVSTINGKYFPSNYGSQSQDHVLHYKLLSLYRNLMIEKLRNYDEQEEIIQQLQAEIRDEKLIDILRTK